MPRTEGLTYRPRADDRPEVEGHHVDRRISRTHHVGGQRRKKRGRKGLAGCRHHLHTGILHGPPTVASEGAGWQRGGGREEKGEGKNLLGLQNPARGVPCEARPVRPNNIIPIRIKRRKQKARLIALLFDLLRKGSDRKKRKLRPVRF